MKRKIFLLIALSFISFSLFAQVENANGVRRRSEKERKQQTGAQGITDRMQSLFQENGAHDADIEYMRQIYRQLDLTQAQNAPLYFPEDVIDGNENLFRIILRLVVDGKIPAYEYLDGREIFSDQYRVNVGDMLERFGIYAQEGKGSTEKNPKFVIEEADVPTGQVLNYYIIEKWEFDRRSNSMKTYVEAICPVLNRSGDFGGEARYPMFWVKYDALRPHLARQFTFMSDDNNIERYSLDDFFTLGLYDGEIYKTKNLRNLSLAQMFPDEDDRKRAQDSIDNRLRSYGKDLWVPTREEYLAMREKEEIAKAEKEKAIAEGSEIPERTVVDAAEPDEEKTRTTSVRSRKRSSTKKSPSATPKKKSAPKKAKVSSSSSSSSGANSSATKSVRRRKR
ncbi:MAG: gliding motility protein GldN [Muribaculaceae bacterium]|nr:gliding motility protein GldN [Muribaculaceae bacterium]